MKNYAVFAIVIAAVILALPIKASAVATARSNAYSICCGAAFLFLCKSTQCSQESPPEIQQELSVAAQENNFRLLRGFSIIDPDRVQQLASLTLPDGWRSGKRTALYLIALATQSDVPKEFYDDDFSIGLTIPHQFAGYVNKYLASTALTKATVLSADRISKEELFNLIKENIDNGKPLGFYFSTHVSIALATIIGYQDTGDKAQILLLPDYQQLSLSAVLHQSNMSHFLESLRTIAVGAAFANMQSRRVELSFTLLMHLKPYNFIALKEAVH